MSLYHTPVLLQEVIIGLDVRAGKRFIDATLGGGGHTFALLKRGCFVLGIDQDAEAISYVQENFKSQMPNDTLENILTIRKGNFGDIEAIAKSSNFDQVDGVLFDLGVSSHQIDNVTRGFSFRFPDGPLDMRFDQRAETITAEAIVNTYSESALSELFATLGEEERAQDVAKAVIRSRAKQHIKTTGQLKEAILSVNDSRDTVARIFQALRIATNEELDMLRKGLEGAKALVRPGGRIAVISFHSLEDRMVKQFFRLGKFSVITKHPIIASYEEQQKNSRSRSAKLRIAEKI